jgi:hypothetical protein
MEGSSRCPQKTVSIFLSCAQRPRRSLSSAATAVFLFSACLNADSLANHTLSVLQQPERSSFFVFDLEFLFLTHALRCCATLRGTRSRHARDRFSPCCPARNFGRRTVYCACPMQTAASQEAGLGAKGVSPRRPRQGWPPPGYNQPRNTVPVGRAWQATTTTRLAHGTWLELPHQSQPASSARTLGYCLGYCVVCGFV